MRQVYDNQTIANTSTEDNTTRSAHQHMGCITVWFTTNPGWTHGLISSLDKPLPHPFYRQNKKGYNTPGKTTWNGLHRRQTSQADTTLVHTATHHQVDPSFVGGLQYTSRTTSLLKPIGRQQTHRLLRKQDSLQTSNASAHTLSYKNAITLKDSWRPTPITRKQPRINKNHIIPRDSHFAQTLSSPGSQRNKHTNHTARFL